VGRTLHSILSEVLLCTVAAMGLVVSYLPRGTCCQSYSVFVSTTVVVFPGAEADAVVVAAAEDLALRALALADEGPLFSLQLCLCCSFLPNLLLHDLRSFCYCLMPGQMLLHEAQTLVFLVEARQLILDDCFDFFLQILL
jgi:hypothetical protein